MNCKKVVYIFLIIFLVMINNTVFAATISSDSYKVDNSNKIIYRVDANISKETFEKEVDSTINYTITDANNNILAAGSIIKTGDEVRLENGDIYKISVLGDVYNNDGFANIIDAKIIAQHIISKDNDVISGTEYTLAADYIEDSKIKMNDVIKMIKNPKIKISANKRHINYDASAEEAIQVVATSSTGEAPVYSIDNTLLASVDEKTGVINKMRRTGRIRVTATFNNSKRGMDFLINGSRIHFINLGQAGNAFLLESNGQFALYDAGSSKTGEILSYISSRYGIEELEFILLSHPHVDHYGDIIDILRSGVSVKKIYRKHYLNTDADCVKNSDKVCYDESTLDNISSFTGLKELMSTSSIYYNHRHIEAVAKNNDVEIIYVDDDIDTYEGKAAITLGNMKLILYNVRQRMENSPSEHGEFDYDSSSYWATKTENVNSIMALVRVNNYNVLLTGDEEQHEILESVLEKVYALVNTNSQTLDVFNIPHHANYRCVNAGMRIGKTGYTKLDSNNLDKKAIEVADAIGGLPYYIASMPSDTISWQKDDSGNQIYDENGIPVGYYRIANGSAAAAKNGVELGCMYKLGIPMSSVYFTADAVYSSGNKGAVVLNLNENNIGISYGKNKSCRASITNGGDIYEYAEAISKNSACDVSPE